MLFNSFEFALFFPIVTCLYFALRGTWRIYWLLAASFVFYSVYIPAYSAILIVVILIDYCTGVLLDKTESRGWRRVLIGVSLTSNLGILCGFKYFNFLNANLAALLGHVNVSYSPWIWKWALPVGLSFHTFQSMAYTIEVYRRRYPADRSLAHVALYVVFYPQLVAGPIERPHNLLRQLHLPQRFRAEDFRSGMQLMLWGLFKKAAVADRLSFVTDSVFSGYAKAPAGLRGPAVALGAIAFAFQIYCDFSGYSDIAIGAARVMGFRLATNFRRPYFATSFQEFWKRWHVSLSSWFRDYVYIPLGGGKHGPGRMVLAMAAVFLVSGLWHGANWTFVAWGALHAVYRIGEWVLSRFGNARTAPAGLRFAQGLAVFLLTSYAWIFFRAASITDAWRMTTGLADGWGSLAQPVELAFQLMDRFGGGKNFGYATIGVAILLFVDSWAESGNLRRWFEGRPVWQRAVAYNAAMVGLYAMWAKDQQAFLYFQF